MFKKEDTDTSLSEFTDNWVKATLGETFKMEANSSRININKMIGK